MQLPSNGKGVLVDLTKGTDVQLGYVDNEKCRDLNDKLRAAEFAAAARMLPKGVKYHPVRNRCVCVCMCVRSNCDPFLLCGVASSHLAKHLRFASGSCR